MPGHIPPDRRDAALPGGRDWICAPATGSPRGAAIAIVRLDGPGCWDAAARLWRAAGGKGSGGLPPASRRLTRGALCDADGRRLDDILLAWFPGPESFTGNDLVEFQCHGGPGVQNALLESLIGLGVRMAHPGEFTQRAFLNGRMDLAEAEAVANLVAARTARAARTALAQLRGAVSRQVEKARDGLLDFLAEVESRLDFPEEDLAPADLEVLSHALADALGEVRALAETSRRGRLLRDGARIVLAGRPNTGKSSLLNALVGMERAIVTPHAGTTRDTIETTLDLEGVPVVLVDTAGVRESGDGTDPESLGIRRALDEARSADLVLLVLDGSEPLSDEDRRIHGLLGDTPRLVVVNKSDLAARIADVDLDRCFGADCLRLRVSALSGRALDGLERTLLEALGVGGEDPESAVVTNLRHADLLQQAAASLSRALDVVLRRAPVELAAVDVREAVDALGAILGREIGEEVLDRVFSRFCIGK